MQYSKPICTVIETIELIKLTHIYGFRKATVFSINLLAISESSTHIVETALRLCLAGAALIVSKKANAAVVAAIKYSLVSNYSRVRVRMP